MTSQHQFTVDCEFDWGGRTYGTTGLTQGLPRILSAFRQAGVRGLFFVSTELLQDWGDCLWLITNQGHEIGSHGHFHTIYKDRWRAEADRHLSLKLLAEYQSVPQESIRYRAPKFNYEVRGEQYSYRKAHVSLLRHMWLKEKIKEDTIIYLHPFDIVETKEKAPNLFCKLWYSQPKKAYETLIDLLESYPGSDIINRAVQKIA